MNIKKAVYYPTVAINVHGSVLRMYEHDNKV